MKASIDILGTDANLNAVFIRDMSNEDPTAMSVTNDAEAVVAYILGLHPGRRIVYKDTMDQWDELLHDGEKFTGFGPWNMPTIS